MKKTIKQLPVLSSILCAVLLSVTSCDKDDDKPLSAKEKQLTVREWRLTDITRPKISNTSQDSSILKACSSDDTIVFGINGNNRSFHLRDNTTKCDSSIFFYDNGNWWTLNGAQDELQLNGFRRIQRWKILLLNDSILRVQWRDSISNSNIVLKTISLKNK